MSAHVLPAHDPAHPSTWLRRLGLSLLLFLGACIAYLPYAFYPLITPPVRPFLWGATTAGLLAGALLARRSPRLQGLLGRDLCILCGIHCQPR